MIKMTEMLTNKSDLEARVEAMLSQQRYSDVTKAGTSGVKRGAQNLEIPAPVIRKKLRSETRSIAMDVDDQTEETDSAFENNSEKSWNTQGAHGRGFKRNENNENQIKNDQNKENQRKGEKVKGGQTKNRPRKPVQWGKGRKENGTFAAMAADFDVFVCNTHNSTTEDTVKDALKHFTSDENGEGGVEALEVECRSREGMFKKSWRVSVAFTDREKVLSPESWPEGWGCRRYFRAKTSQTSTTPNVTTPTVDPNAQEIVQDSATNNTAGGVPRAATAGGTPRSAAAGGTPRATTA